MAYIGNQPADIGVYAVQAATGNGSTTVYTLDRAATTASISISIDGVDQIPTTAYAVTVGTTLTFTSAPPNLSVISIRFLGDTVTFGEPSNNSVTSAKIVDGAIVNADVNASAAIAATKIADGSVTSAEFQHISTLSSNAQTQITARLPLAGGTMSGTLTMADEQILRPELKDYSECQSSEGNVTGTVNIDLEYGNVVTATIVTGATTLNLINPPVSGKAGTVTLFLTNGGSQTVTWDAQIKWAGGTAPTLTTSGIDCLSFITYDAGTSWYGFAAGLDMS